MANPQKENGFTPIANEIIEELCRRKLTGREFRVLLFTIRKTYGYHKKEDWISLSQYQKGCYLYRSGVCKVLKRLVSYRVLLKLKKGYMLNKNYDEWGVSPTTLDDLGSVVGGSLGSVVEGNQVVSRATHTKDNLQKKLLQKKEDIFKKNKNQYAVEIDGTVYQNPYYEEKKYSKPSFSI
jgi:phage replication O-like protein O